MDDGTDDSERILAPKHLLDESASALAKVFNDAKISYAFCGGYLAMVFGVPNRGSEDVDCIVQGNMIAAKSALTASSRFEIVGHGVAGAAGAVHAHYLRSDGSKLPVELLRAGEFGPMKLTSSNTIMKDGLRFLNPTEFVRSKIKAWTNRAAARDKVDILWMLRNMASDLDIERINPDNDLDAFAEQDEEVEEVWSVLQAADDDGDTG